MRVIRSGRRRVKSAASAIGASLILAALAVSGSTEASGGLPDGTLGQYLGFDAEARFDAVERSLKTDLDWVVAMATVSNPADMRSAVWGQFSKPSAYLPKHSDRLDVSVTLPLSFDKGGKYRTVGPAAVRRALELTTSGRYDDDFRAVARRLKSAGYGDAVLRLGHEFDGTWQPWSARENEQAYIDAFRHVHDVLQAESAAFRFEWTGMHGTWRKYARDAYPGDAYVDIIGLDVYYRKPYELGGGDERQITEALVAHQAFAVDRGKPVSYPEWGRARGDTTRFIELMYDWFESLPSNGPGSLVYQAYFNPAAQKGLYDLANYPAVADRYYQLFRNKRAASDSPPVRTPAPSAIEPRGVVGIRRSTSG